MATTTERNKLLRGGSLELVGRTEAAEILGINRSNLGDVRGFPSPVVDYLKAGHLWLRSDVEAFHGEFLKRPKVQARRSVAPAPTM